MGGSAPWQSNGYYGTLPPAGGYYDAYGSSEGYGAYGGYYDQSQAPPPPPSGDGGWVKYHSFFIYL